MKSDWTKPSADKTPGFGGTITTLIAAVEPEIRALLNIPDGFAVCAAVPLGRPVKQLTKLRRHAVEEIATRDRFDGEPFTLG